MILPVPHPRCLFTYGQCKYNLQLGWNEYGEKDIDFNSGSAVYWLYDPGQATQ